MNSKIIYVGLLLAICLSLYFAYERSFVTRDFEIVNSEEEEAPVDMSTEQEAIPTTEEEAASPEAE
ncbi:MAG TPA: hypothetical protein VNU25_02735 [Candidatus Paceibacterota bacterium]|nr:hypothetical protein [Candidatus Paceibacterota bacterium]